jgi:uncharacterized protein
MIITILLGLVAGIFSGLVGLGGGVIVVPFLVMFFGFSQHTAQGTTLAMMIPPIGILAAWTYYQQGFVDLKVAGFLIIGFIVGGYFGAKLALLIPKELMQKIFGISIILIGIRMLIK